MWFFDLKFDKMSTDMARVQMYFFAVMFIAVLLLAFFVFLPFLIPLTIAATFAVLFYPLYRRFLVLTHQSERVSALLTVFTAVVVLLVPFLIIGSIVFQEAAQFIERGIQNGTQNSFASFAPQIEHIVRPLMPEFSFDVHEYAKYIASWIVEHVGAIFSGIVQFTVNLFIILLAFYYFLRNGKELIRTFIELSPLPDVHDTAILTTLQNAMYSVVSGSLMVSAIQGFVAGVGFALFGVPNPALFGSFAALSALIPAVGTSLVVVPAIFYLFFIGSTQNAIGLIIWGACAVGLIDNFLGPMLMKRGLRVHTFPVLLAVLGGLRFFGAFGFLLGPLVLALCIAMLEIYRSLAQEGR